MRCRCFRRYLQVALRLNLRLLRFLFMKTIIGSFWPFFAGLGSELRPFIDLPCPYI